MQGNDEPSHTRDISQVIVHPRKRGFLTLILQGIKASRRFSLGTTMFMKDLFPSKTSSLVHRRDSGTFRCCRPTPLFMVRRAHDMLLALWSWIHLSTYDSIDSS